ANVIGHEAHCAAADVEPELVVVDAEQRISVLHFPLKHADASREVGTEATAALPADRNTDDGVGHPRHDVAVVNGIEVAVTRLEELGRVREVALESENTSAHPAD